jgi:DNA polymerase III psi subunit
MEDMKIDELLNIFNETLYVDVPSNSIEWTVKGNLESETAVFLLKNDFPQENEIFLTKVLGACKLTQDNYAVILLDNESNIFQGLNAHSRDTNLVFGIKIESSSFSMKRDLNKPFRFNTKKMLLSNSLSDLVHNDVLKTQLWTNGLKPLYKI